MNSCTFIGRLVRDPELRSVSDTSVCNFSIAVNRRYKSNGENKEEVNYLDMVAWDKGAESIASYFKKGDPIIVYSSAKTESWVDKDENKRSKIVFRVEKFEFPPTNSRKADSEQSEESAPATVSSGSASGQDEIPF